MAFHSYDVGRLGFLVQVGLRVDNDLAKVGRGGPPSSWTALIDTGASRTVISPAVVRVLDPQLAASVKILRPEVVENRVFTYRIELRLDGHLSSGRWFGLEVADTQPATPGIDVLIGMDLLMQFHLYLSGPGGKLVISS